ncbi:MAG TPA: hypothetical protein VJ930_04855 [Acidimicrobiia bacterium]|nr:hypothetical protein [Acidimicrobiia bacterium]
MTDLITRPVVRREEPTGGMRAGTKGTIIALALVIGILAGWVVFTNAGPSRAALEQAHWQQVVDYYEQKYPAIADAEARREAAHWQEVVNHYARQYDLIANATRVPAVDRERAHWESVVDYYDQQWELRGQ